MNDNNKTTLSAADVEQNIGNEPLATEETERLDTRINIHVISYRARNHDPDGISAKAVIDGIVRRGILSDDSAKEVKKVSFESVISKEERTEIIITKAALKKY